MKKKIIYGIMIIILIASIPLTKLLISSGQKYQMIKYGADKNSAREVLRMNTHTGEIDYGYIKRNTIKWTKLEDISDF